MSKAARSKNARALEEGPLQDAEPIVECPSILTELAREEWDRLAPLLAKAGRLTPLDRGPLALYCNAFAAWVEAETAIQAVGAIIKSPSGYPQVSPYVSIAQKNAELMIRIAGEFGFTPASRNRLPKPPSSNPYFLDVKPIEELMDIPELKID